MLKNKPFQLAIIATLLIFGVITVVVLMNNNNEPTETAHHNQPSIEGQPTLGNTDSPVQVVEFGDFKCPSCKAWGETIYPQLVSDYVDNDEISFSYINVLFHGEESKLASLAAESVYKEDPDSYWDFHKMVYDEQESNHDAQWVTTEKMLEIAEATTDVDLAQLESDLEQEAMADAVNLDTDLVEEYEVQFTPSIMVNGTMLEDPFDYEAMKEIIDEALEESE